MLLTLILLACVTTTEVQESAEQNASQFTEKMQWDIQGVSCSGSDSDLDGYTSCTISMTDDSTKSIECGYVRMFAWTGQNTSCKMAQPITIMGEGS